MLAVDSKLTYPLMSAQKTTWFQRVFLFPLHHLLIALAKLIAPLRPGNTNTNSSSPSSLPGYIDYPGNIVMEPPYKLNRSLMYWFVFESNGGSTDSLQKILDQRLNFSTSSRYRYKAFTSDVFITFATTPEDTSIPQRQRGFVAEKEMLAWILTLEEIHIGGRWRPNRLVWFVPYIFVDNAFAMASGRETFGFPKTLGSFEIPEDPSNAVEFVAKTSAFKTFGPNERLKEYPLLQLTAEAGLPEAHSWADSRHAFSEIKKIIMEGKGLITGLPIRLCIHELEDLLELEMSWVFLKQFRSLLGSETADFQAIVEAPIHLEGFHGAGFLDGSFKASINNLASFPLAQDLGLSDGQLSRRAFWSEVDFSTRLGRELWKA